MSPNTRGTATSRHPNALPATPISKNETANPPLPQRPSKRKQAEDEGDATIVEPETPTNATNKKAKLSYEKHDRFWVLDGNVVLEIQNTRFKLHRSRLATQSKWFEALFEKRAGGEVTVEEGAPDLDSVIVEDEDGTDVYYLDSTEVSLDDFVELLTAMEDTIDYCSKRQPLPIHVAVFTAATILRFDKFAEYAKKNITSPTIGFSDSLDAVTHESRLYVIDAVLLGRTWLPKILKRAFYELARMSDIRDIGTQEPALDPPEIAIGYLPPSDLQLVTYVQKELALAWADVLALQPYDKCRVQDCTAARTRPIYEAVHNSGIGKAFVLDPICGLQALIGMKWFGELGYCQNCAKRRKKELAEMRKKIWTDLDDWLRQ
ncbi:hypothetical protein BD626DRAFT_564445 [Schizophyllum amplum]|uniref:BTB domain-containing protein n=1 Tax=Schizophyllum amplum TaxID=97359 RepID=A0A550CRT2_9AGAR|nr:hypothetical protein BD626DRAFT_564445 [Auriculariopsis ampla]